METDIRSLVKHLTTSDPLAVADNGGNQPPQHKKQVRRRLQTSKRYQEKLLNMAEARREIVTALKFHRASMKQQQQQAAAGNNQPSSSLDQQKSRPISSFYPPTTPTATTALSAFAPPPPPPSSYYDCQNLVLPSQTLGLNLDFRSFSNLDTNIYRNLPASQSSSSSPAALSVPGGSSSSSSGDRHHAMDGNEMKEIRSLGERHQIEWNDTISLVTSARWSNFLKTMEVEEDGFHQIMEFPPWLISANESSCLEQQFDDHLLDTYSQDPTLPCMDIGEIDEPMDGEWLA